MLFSGGVQYSVNNAPMTHPRAIQTPTSSTDIPTKNLKIGIKQYKTTSYLLVFVHEQS